MCHLSHSYHSGACLYFTFAFGPTRPPSRVSTTWSIRRSSRRSWTTARHSRITTRSAPSTRSGSSRTSRRPGWRCSRHCSPDRPGQHLNPGKIVGTNARVPQPPSDWPAGVQGSVLDPGVSRHATEAEIESAYERGLRLLDPEHYPGSTEDAYRRLGELNAAYAQIRGEAPDPDDSEEPTDEPDERHAAIADVLVRLGFILSDARRPTNPAVDVLATLLPQTTRSPSVSRASASSLTVSTSAGRDTACSEP